MDHWLLERANRAPSKKNAVWAWYLFSDAANDWLVKTHYPSFYKRVYQHMTGVNKVDAVRLCYLHRYGGIYADFDFQCLRPWDSFLVETEKKHDVVLGTWYSEARLRARKDQNQCEDEHFFYLHDRVGRKNSATYQHNSEQAIKWMQDFTKTSGATSATFLPSPNSPCLIPEKLPIKFQGRDWPSEKPKNATLADLEKVACGDPEKAETLEARKKLRRDWLLENGAEQAIPNAIIASKPGADFWLHCMELVAQTFEIETHSPVDPKWPWSGNPEHIAGPVMFRRCLSSYRVVRRDKTTPNEEPKRVLEEEDENSLEVGGDTAVAGRSSTSTSRRRRTTATTSFAVEHSRILLLPRLKLYPRIWGGQMCGAGFAEDIVDLKALDKAVDRVQKLAVGNSAGGPPSDSGGPLKDSLAVTFWTHSWSGEVVSGKFLKRGKNWGKNNLSKR